MAPPGEQVGGRVGLEVVDCNLRHTKIASEDGVQHTTTVGEHLRPNPLLVGGFERVGDLTSKGERFLHRQARARGGRPARDALGQRLTLDQLQH
jgi:hypothetical protein